MASRAVESQAEKASLILHNATVVTMDETLAHAEAVAVSAAGKILAVGKEADVLKAAGPATEVIDCGGRLLLPGFVDAHGHFLALGQSKMQLDLASQESFEQIVEAAKEECSRRTPGEWVLGRGWHQEKWKSSSPREIEALPSADMLTEACPKNPVLFFHASGHAAFANWPAIKSVGLGANQKGVLQDSRGKPIGLLWESAVDPVYSAYENWKKSRPAAEREEELTKTVETAARICLQNGVTFFQDAGSTFEEIDFFVRMADENRLPIRLWVMIGEDNHALSKKLKSYRIIRRGQARLTVRAIKRYADGALGSHGAWLLEPYSDRTESTGTQLTSEKELLETARLALEYGFQLCTHAIGDRANRFVLDVYHQALGGKAADLRWRIEHAQHVEASDIPRFAKIGVVASMQASHCVSDGPWVEKRIGQKRAAEGAYAWRSFIDAGVLLANGTDTPVEAEDPILGFYAFVTRRLPNGKDFFPRQKLSRLEALRAMTINAARAAFEDDILGSISVGKLADMVLLSKNILEIPLEQVPGTKVDMTIFDGKVAFKNF